MHVLACVVMVIAVNITCPWWRENLLRYALNCMAGVIDFKLWPVEEWKTCGAYRCFNK